MEHRSVPATRRLPLMARVAAVAAGALALAAPVAAYAAGSADAAHMPAVTAAAGVSDAAVGNAAARPAPAVVRHKVVSIAKRERVNRRHNHEIGGYNCNYYSTKLHAGHRSCRNGWRSEAWCADFARWVWGHGGVNTSHLTPAARSFYRYGVKNHTWNSGPSPAGVHPSDAVVYRGYYHVGIVTAIHHGKITVISGNSGPGSKHVWTKTFTPTARTVAGYTAPVR
jgi:hypothetical protein